MKFLHLSSASSSSGELNELEKKDALLRMSIVDKKDSDKYVKKMENQVREISEQKQQTEARLEVQKHKMTEKSQQNAKLANQIIELKESVTHLAEENTKIKEENAALASQVMDLGDILRERSRNSKNGLCDGSGITAMNQDLSNDISMDEPQGTNKYFQLMIPY